MSHFVKVGSVLFGTKAEAQDKNAGRIVLEEPAGVMAGLKGYDFDLVVFSEAAGALGQTINTAEDINNPGLFLKLYTDFAVSEKCHVAGSMKTIEAGKVYNSAVFINPDGNVLGVYHKTNLTIGEIDEGLTPGKGAVVVDTAIGRLGGIICFDLNFEDIRKEYRELKPDIIVFPSMFHGGFMQKMWAYECRSFFISALPFHGGGIRDPLGNPLAITDCYNGIAEAEVNLDCMIVHLDYNQEKFSDIKKKYGDEVKIDIPANIGSALIYSQTDKRTAMDVVKEFNLELLDDYFERSIKANAENRKK